MIYARKGEKVTCTKGHMIAVFGRDVNRAEPLHYSMFLARQDGIDWRRGERMGPCPVCGAAWNGSDTPDARWGILHFENGGWRR